MRKAILFLIFCLPFISFGQSLKLSNQAEVSLITCGPGSALGDLFGHNAIRIYDPAWGIDKAYGYGGYDFDTPFFYLKFTRGKLMYEATVSDFNRFVQYYQYYNRYVFEQVLDLDSATKQEIYEFVEWNIKPENKEYLYDFFFDNCATKIRDITKDMLGDKVSFNGDHLTTPYSFRDLLRQKTTTMPWISMGMDIALGAKVDPIASAEEHMFLPDYIQRGFDNAFISENGVTKPIVKSSRMIYDPGDVDRSAGIFTPMLVLGILALLVGLFTYKDFKQRKRSRILDFILLFLTGLIGAAVLFLWLASDHQGMRNNLNVLWAFVPNLYVAFLITKERPPRWVRSYVRLLFILLMMMALVWAFGIQVYASAFVPVMLLLGLRYFFLWQKGLART